jgi:hypothetical protein
VIVAITVWSLIGWTLEAILVVALIGVVRVLRHARRELVRIQGEATKAQTLIQEKFLERLTSARKP